MNANPFNGMMGRIEPGLCRMTPNGKIGIKTKKPVADVIKYCMENGVLCLSAKDKLRLLPALNIDFDLLKKAVEVIKTAVEN